MKHQLTTVGIGRKYVLAGINLQLVLLITDGSNRGQIYCEK